MTGKDTIAPNSFDKIFASITEKELTESEENIIYLRYVKGYTIKYIAALNEQNPERIRQIISKAMRKLRAPKNRWMLCCGYDYMKALKKRNDAQAEYDKLLLEVQKQQSKLNSNKIHEVYEKAEEIERKTKILQKSMNSNDDSTRLLKETLLEDLGLQTRTWKALYRYFCNNNMPCTAESIVILGEKKLRNINRLGKQSVDEICDIILERFGFDIRKAS